MKKVKTAVTDSDNKIGYDQEKKPGLSNLLTIYSAITEKSVDQLLLDYEGKGYGQFKTELADVIISFLKPVKEKYDRIIQDRQYLTDILKKSASYANEKSSRKIDQVYKTIGFIGK